MKILQPILTFFESLDQKKFYQYIGIFLGVTILASGFLVYRYYSRVRVLTNEINNLNETRAEEILPILKQAEKVRQERTAVNKMLEEDSGFKIGYYFKQLIAELNLASKLVKDVTSLVRRDDEYSESILQAEFISMTMKEVSELLYKIEQTTRVYPKNLEIVRSKKVDQTVDVNLTIATLHKSEQAEA